MQRLYEPQAYASPVGSYWETTAPQIEWPELGRNTSAHTVIIGGGYTGLNCALALQRKGIDPAAIVVLEAEQPGFGASGRNGGFCCLGGSKLTAQQAIKRFGFDDTLEYLKTQQASIETVRNNLERFHINADIHSVGETQLAYRLSAVKELEQEQKFLADSFGVTCDLLTGTEFAQSGFNSPEFFAALTNPHGFALNPMKYISGLTDAARQRGIKTFGKSPALSIANQANGYCVKTPNGTVKADHLVIATNGYSSEDTPRWLSGRLMPILTNIIVTRPLTSQELADQGWTSHQMCYDTRNSLHYFRLMPGVDGESPRMLFGMRGGTSATEKSAQSRYKKIRADFDRIFPAWRSVATPFFWSGLACLTRDLTSFTGPIPEMKNAWASLAYHGNGVAMGSHCGVMTAAMITGELAPDALPDQMRKPPRKFPFPAFRRSYLNAAFRWYDWLDG